MKEKILIIDGHSLAYRSFFAFPASLSLPDGRPINAVYGFVTLMLKCLEQFAPHYICICFDRKEKTFRHEMYTAYKGHRPPAPDAFIAQLPILDEILATMNISTISLAGFEADDLIGTLAKSAEKQGLDALIMTGDMDSLQLVSPHTSVISSKKGGELMIYTPPEVVNKYQLTPDQIVDFKALKGDPSDNIPGVAGIGDKTATQLLHQFQTLDNLYNNIDQVASASVKAKLETNKSNAFLSQTLATIHCEVPIEIDFEVFRYQPDWIQIIEYFREYRFTTLVKAYESKCPRIEAQVPLTDTIDVRVTDYQSIDTVEALKAILPYLSEGFAIDLETTSVTAVNAQICGVSLSWSANQAVYIPMNHLLGPTPQQDHTLSLFGEAPKSKASYYELNPFLAMLKPLLEDKSIAKWTHNGKYERMVFKNYQIDFKGIRFDTMLAAFLLYPTEQIGLKSLAARHLGITMTTYESLTGKGKHQIPFNMVPIDKAVQYACADSDVTFQLKQKFEPLISERALGPLLYEIELPLQDILADMECTGVAIDTPYLNQLSHTFSTELQQVQATIFELAGTTFNLSSPKQLSQILFEKLQLPVIKKTKTGLSTDSSVLEKLEHVHPIAKELLRFRMLEKLQNTYVTVLPTLLNPRTHKIHTSFNQTIAITGRLSSTNPNLQNIPIRSEAGQKIRGAFIPSGPEYRILSADYSQIELRLIAHLAQDPTMIAAFQAFEDIHTSTAAVIFGCSISEVTKEQRYQAKAVNFGILYGVSAFGLSENIGVSRAEAKQIIDDYFTKFATIRQFINTTIKEAEGQGLVRTLGGRIRPLPDIKSPIRSVRQFAERTAVNTRVQGSAADILKLAMIKIDHALREGHYRSRMLIQVHDELVFDIYQGEEEAVSALIKREMESAYPLQVPLEVDLAIGKNWQELG